MFFVCSESNKVFNMVYFTEHLRATASVFVSFSEILVKKAFWMIL